MTANMRRRIYGDNHMISKEDRERKQEERKSYLAAAHGLTDPKEEQIRKSHSVYYA